MAIPCYYSIYGTRVPYGTHVPWYVPNGTVLWYTCTNITLSQKQLEIQALSGATGTQVGVVSTMVLEYHYWYVPLWYQLVRSTRLAIVPLVPTTIYGID